MSTTSQRLSPVRDDRIPVEVVFSPNWWFRNYRISFDRRFYFDRYQRIEDDVKMRRALHERFGLGEADPTPRPIIGSQHVAGGFVAPAQFGVEVRFSQNMAPWTVPANLSRKETMALRVPDLRTIWPMSHVIEDMDALEREFGYVIGDVNPGGILNTALDLRGQQLFFDLAGDCELTSHLFRIVAETTALIAGYFRRRTGTCAVSVNRSIVNVDPAIFLHSNCSVQMISPAMYQESLLPHDCYLATKLSPYGIHHCGTNLQRYAVQYSRTGSCFYDVGWGSDVAQCARSLPDTFLNLRLSPIRFQQGTTEDVEKDTACLLEAVGRTKNIGICVINTDYGTPDRNVLAMIEAVREFSPQ